MARDKIRHVDLRPDEFIAGTFGQLTIEQFAVYWAVCLAIYSKGGPVDDDAKRFHAAFRWTHKERSQARVVRRALDDLIDMGKLKRDRDGKLSNGRTMDEIAAAARRVAKARANGALGGRPPRSLSAAQAQAKRRLTTPRMRNINDLTKPEGFQLLNPKKTLSSLDKDTDAARARERSLALSHAHDTGPIPKRPRAKSKSDKRLEELAAEARAKLLKPTE